MDNYNIANDNEIYIGLTKDEGEMLFYFFSHELNSGGLSESSQFGQLAARLRNILENYVG